MSLDSEIVIPTIGVVTEAALMSLCLPLALPRVSRLSLKSFLPRKCRNQNARCSCTKNT